MTKAHLCSPLPPPFSRRQRSSVVERVKWPRNCPVNVSVRVSARPGAVQRGDPDVGHYSDHVFCQAGRVAGLLSLFLPYFTVRDKWSVSASPDLRGWARQASKADCYERLRVEVSFRFPLSNWSFTDTASLANGVFTSAPQRPPRSA